MRPGDRGVDDLAAGLARGERLLGLDLGTKTIGLALSDVERRIATPLETITRQKFTPDAERLRAVAARFGVGGLVVGLPSTWTGAKGRAPRRRAPSCAA
jgi:putative Holliday junction resolvase